MKKIANETDDKFARSRGVSLFEMLIILVIIGVLGAVSIPQLLATRRLMKFTSIQQQLSANLREARQLARAQNVNITLQYDDTNKVLRIYGGTFGILGATTNRVVVLTDSGLPANYLKYGVPPVAPVPTLPLEDTTTLTPLMGGVVDVMFNPRGDVVEDATGAPFNRALFFYEENSKSAFAVSILGPGGRTRIWRLNGSTYQ